MSGVVSESELAEEPPGTIEKIRLNLKIQMLKMTILVNLTFWTIFDLLLWFEYGRMVKNVLEVGF